MTVSSIGRAGSGQSKGRTGRTTGTDKMPKSLTV
jgi:hypothetical protein